MEDFFITQNNHGIMDEQEEDIGSFSSSSSSSLSSAGLMEDAISSSSDDLEEEDGSALFEMSSLIAQLPLKRGLSKHFQGKSQSFSSLINVRSIVDLAKPKRPCKKKMKSSKSCGGGLDSHNPLSFKKTSRGSFSSLGPKKLSFSGNNRPPVAPQRSSGNLSNQAFLFA